MYQTNGIGSFLFALLSWTVVQALILQDGFSLFALAFACLFGATYGYWLVAGIAFAEMMASVTVRSTYQPLGYLLFVTMVFAVAFALVWFGQSSKKALSLLDKPFFYIGPTIIPIVIYLFRNLKR